MLPEPRSQGLFQWKLAGGPQCKPGLWREELFDKNKDIAKHTTQSEGSVVEISCLQLTSQDQSLASVSHWLKPKQNLVARESRKCSLQVPAPCDTELCTGRAGNR